MVTVSTQYEETDFPSLADYNQASGGNSEDWPAHETVEDGEYQFAVLMITPPMENRFPNPKYKTDNPKPIRYIYFQVVDAETPSDIGKVVRKRVTHSGHPKSSGYPFLQAAYGGSIAPEIRPSFSQLEGKQLKAFLTTRMGDAGREYQAWEAVRSVPAEKYKEAPPW